MKKNTNAQQVLSRKLSVHKSENSEMYSALCWISESLRDFTTCFFFTNVQEKKVKSRKVNDLDDTSGWNSVKKRKGKENEKQFRNKDK